MEQLLWDFGGAKRDRTADLLHAMQALSQLSYSPTSTTQAVKHCVTERGAFYGPALRVSTIFSRQRSDRVKINLSA